MRSKARRLLAPESSGLAGAGAGAGFGEATGATDAGAAGAAAAGLGAFGSSACAELLRRARLLGFDCRFHGTGAGGGGTKNSSWSEADGHVRAQPAQNISLSRLLFGQCTTGGRACLYRSISLELKELPSPN